jgi:LPXTG-motif cell wall-anchored protein
MFHKHRLMLPDPVHVRRAVLCALGLTFALLLVQGTAMADDVTGTYAGAAQGQAVSYAQDGQPRGAWAGTMNLDLDSGERLRVFCVQLHVGVRQGDRYKSDGPVENLPNGCQIRYILDNYPASGSMDDAEAAARQLAVWHFSDGIDLTTIPDALASIRDRSLAIADEAQNGQCPPTRTEAPNLVLEPATATVKVGQRIGYTVTTDTADAGASIHVTVTGPGMLDDGSQAADLELDAAGSVAFGITAHGTGHSEVNVDLSYRLGAGTVFSHIDESQPTQRLVMAQVVDLVAHATSEADFEEAPTETVAAATSVPTATPTVATATSTATQPVLTATATELPSATVTLAASRTPGPGNTPGPAATPVPTGEHTQPARLPSTGGAGQPPWPLWAAGCVLLAVGWLARRRRPAA